VPGKSTAEKTPHAKFYILLTISILTDLCPPSKTSYNRYRSGWSCR
jgi:hypothetical protein